MKKIRSNREASVWQCKGFNYYEEVLVISLEKMRRAAKMISDLTGGKQRFESGPYIRVEDSCTVSMKMRMKPDRENNLYHINFQAFIRRMGVDMDAAGLKSVADEIQQSAFLLAALEAEPFTLTNEEYIQWTQELTDAEQIENQAQTMG